MAQVEPTSIAPPSSWAAYEPTPASPWNSRRVLHLHRRAGFGVGWADLTRDIAAGPAATLKRLLDGPYYRDRIAPDFESISSSIADAAVVSGDPRRLAAWWLFRMLHGPDPLGERLSLMWHNHFATSVRKVADLAAMRQQNDVFRTMGRGRFSLLLDRTVRGPAMMVWLDAAQNQKGAANENLARELMELFVLGVGNYTEADIKQAARALTGWSVAGGKFVIQPETHDDGAKTVFGQTGPWNGDDVLRIVLSQPSAAQRLAWRLCKTFMGENVVDPAAMKELGDGLAARDLDIDWAVRTILTSQLFFSDANLNSLVASPTTFVISAMAALWTAPQPPSSVVLAEWTTRIGQELYAPPNVGGWPEGRSWLNTRTIIARANFAADLVEGKLAQSPHPPDLAGLAKAAGHGSDLAESAMFFNDFLAGGRLAPGTINAILTAAAGANLTDSQKLARVAALILSRPEAQLC